MAFLWQELDTRGYRCSASLGVRDGGRNSQFVALNHPDGWCDIKDSRNETRRVWHGVENVVQMSMFVSGGDDGGVIFLELTQIVVGTSYARQWLHNTEIRPW